MKTRIIIIPAVVILAIGLFFVYITDNGYSPYHAGLYIEEITKEESEEFVSGIDAQEPPVLQTLEILEEEPKVIQLFEKFSWQYPFAKNINDDERRVKKLSSRCRGW